MLQRLKIHYKRARSYIHSPDPDYEAKLWDVQISIVRARRALQRCVVLFQDEFTYYRQPTLAAAYELAGPFQPLARLSYRRVAAALDPFTGRVVYMQASRISVQTLVDFYQQVCATYKGEMIYLVQDNWPTEPSPRARRLNLPIQLLPLPTYASWTNPIEKLWRWVQQEVFHLHRYADRWSELQSKISEFLAQFAEGSQELLRYVGLKGKSNLYGPALAAAGLPPPLPD